MSDFASTRSTRCCGFSFVCFPPQHFILQAELTQLGVAAYVTKPFRLQALLDTIGMVLQGTRLAHDFVTVRAAMALKEA